MSEYEKPRRQRSIINYIIAMFITAVLILVALVALGGVFSGFNTISSSLTPAALNVYNLEKSTIVDVLTLFMMVIIFLAATFIFRIFGLGGGNPEY